MNILIRVAVMLFGLFITGQGLTQENVTETEDFQRAQGQARVIISDQIEAFGALDIDRAYSHASKSIKTIFPSSKIFGVMVRKSYPMIWNPKSYEFLGASPLSVGILQRVMFVDQEGQLHFFDYALEKDGERWLISGVYAAEEESRV